MGCRRRRQCPGRRDRGARKKLTQAVRGALGGSIDGEALLPEATFYLSAFWEIATCRPIGFGRAPVPFTAIDVWASRHGLAGEEFEFFADLIRACDRAWLEFAAEQDGGAPQVSGRPMSPE